MFDAVICSRVCVALSLIVTSALSTLPFAAAQTSLSRETPPYRGLDANLYMQTSAEYRAACYQSFQLASLRLRQALPEAKRLQQNPAVVLDLDETVLDNGGFQTWLLQSSLIYNQSFFDRWELHGGDQVRLVPGAKEFLQEAQSLGVTAIFISNRNERFRAQTKQTLARLGIPITDERHLKLSTTTSDKSARRGEVSRDGYHALLHIGDNLRDFDERFRTPSLPPQATSDTLDEAIRYRKEQVDQTRDQWGRDWIILPNPAYGEWMKPLGRGLDDLQRSDHLHTTLGIAFWNVENLFDLIDDPNVEGDEEFTPNGPNRWTKERLEIKLGNLAAVIKKMHRGTGPVILGLAEVENREVLEMLIERLKDLGRDYRIVHQDSPSGRGIDCAAIYDAKQVELVEAKFHFVNAETTRDIVEARFKAGDKTLTIFVNHWPSRAHDASFRMTAGNVLRKRVDELLQSDPLADLLAMGDFNDHPIDPSLREALGTVNDLSDLSGSKLFNSSYAEVPDSTSGSYVYDDQWEILDQIILSPGLLIPGGVSWVPGSTQSVILASDQLFDPPGPAPPRPSRSYSSTTFHKNGYSDHLPVVTTLQW